MDSGQASIALLAVTSSVGVFTSFLPDLPDVRKSSPISDDMRRDVRVGEIAATALVVAIGFTASSLTGSPLPTVLAVGSALALIGLYESVLSTPPKGIH